METVLNDAFHPRIYTNHIPTQTVTKNNEIMTIIAIAAGLIVLGVVVYNIHKMNAERNKVVGDYPHCYRK